MRAQLAQQRARAAACAWTDPIAPDQFCRSMDKRGPNAPGQPLASGPEAVGPRRPKSPTPKPSMLPTGGFPADAYAHPHSAVLDSAAATPAAAAAVPAVSPLAALVARSRSPSPSPSPPASAASTPERRKKQQQQQQQQQEVEGKSPAGPHPPQPSGGGLFLLEPKRRALALPEFSRRLDRVLHPAGMPRPDFLYTHTCDPAPAPSFRPTINARSAEMAGARWRARARSEVFALLHSEGALKVQRLEEARAAKAARVLDECTFRPFLFDYRGGQPRYHYPDKKAWAQRVAPTPRARSAFAVERRGRFEAPRPRSTPPVRMKGQGAYNTEATPTHDWPKPVVRRERDGRGGGPTGCVHPFHTYQADRPPPPPPTPKTQHEIRSRL